MDLKFEIEEDLLAGKLNQAALDILAQAIPDYEKCLHIFVKDKWLNYHLHKAVGSKGNKFMYQFAIVTMKGISHERFFVLQHDSG